ncbi:MAG: hypothetical protein HWN79_08590 [Candidatus Lokiarchaeota archaeon]|nr:hypothetical protein [Candidatus Lokiarchaeota archaeon]
MTNSVKWNIIKLTLITIGAILIGLIVIFSFSLHIPGDPVLAYLPEGPINWTVYEQTKQQLGLNDPIFMRFIRYVAELFTGNLGRSFSIARTQPVFELLVERIPISIGFPLLPLFLGLTAGIFLGILSIKIRKRFVKILIQIFVVLGISLPMLFIGFWFQYTLAFQMGLFPTIGGLFLPSCILFILTLFLTTRQVRSNYLKLPEERSIWSNSIHTLFNISILIPSIVILEVIFDITGILKLLLNALRFADYWVIRSGISVLVLLIIFILFLSNLAYTIYNLILEKGKSRAFTNFFGRSEQIAEESARYSLNSGQKFTEFTIYRLKSPLTILGLVIVFFITVITVFPQLFTPLSAQEALGIYPDAFEPPSPSHPLGTTIFGRDVLALLVYGVSTSFRVSLFTVCIGLGIGTLLGYLSKVHRIVKEIILGLMVILFIIPSFLMVLLSFGIFGFGEVGLFGVLSAYVIPGIALVISKGDYSLKRTVKKLITYIPLFLGVNILIFEAVGFLLFGHFTEFQLAADIDNARIQLFPAPWATLWPGMGIFILVLGFFALHYGLKEPIPIAGRL